MTPTCSVCNRPVNLEDPETIIAGDPENPIFNRQGEELSGVYCGIMCRIFSTDCISSNSWRSPSGQRTSGIKHT